MNTITLYRFSLSGHSHRVELMLSLLGIEASIVDVDLPAGEHRQTAFLQKNPFGQIPVLEDGDITIADSNAILVYLASKYDPMRCWLPTEARQAAEVQRFLSLAAGPVAYGPAAARRANLFGAKLDQQYAIDMAHQLLGLLDDHLMHRKWLAADRPTIADIANYSYIAHAPEGNVTLKPYPAVRYWLKQIEGLCGFISMPDSAIGLLEE